MSRSGYTYDCDYDWNLIMYRGSVASATKGARGQKLLRDLLTALDNLPEKRLIDDELVGDDGSVCALGALGREKLIDMKSLDPHEPEQVAQAFNIATALAREIVFENDDGGPYQETPEHRFARMRKWVASQIKP